MRFCLTVAHVTLQGHALCRSKQRRAFYIHYFIQYSRHYMHHLTMCLAFTIQKVITEHFIIGCTCRTGFPGPLSIWAPYSISRQSPIMIQETLVDWMLSQRHLHSPLHSCSTQTKDCSKRRGLQLTGQPLGFIYASRCMKHPSFLQYLGFLIIFHSASKPT